MFHAGSDATLDLSLTFTPAEGHRSDLDLDPPEFSGNLCVLSEKKKKKVTSNSAAAVIVCMMAVY